MSQPTLRVTIQPARGPSRPRARALYAGCLLAILFGAVPIACHWLDSGARQATPALGAARTAMLQAKLTFAGTETNRWELFSFSSLALGAATIAFGALGIATVRAAAHAGEVVRSVAVVGGLYGQALLVLGVSHRLMPAIYAGGGMVACFAQTWRVPRR